MAEYTEPAHSMRSPEASISSKKDTLFTKLRRKQRNLFVAGVAALSFGLEAQHSANAQKESQSIQSAQISGNTDNSGLEHYGLKLGHTPEQQQIPVEFPPGSLYATANPQEGYERINIRQAQSIDSAIATTLNRGERFVVRLPESGVPGWYEAYDSEGNLLGFVHASVLRLEQSPVPPTPLPVQPSPVPEVVQSDNEVSANTTSETDQENMNESGSEPAGIPEIIAPTAAPVLTPFPSEAYINWGIDPEYTRRFYTEWRVAQQTALDSLNLEPIPASQVHWMTQNGETIPMGIIDYYLFEETRNYEPYFAFAGIFRGATEYEIQGITNVLFVVDVNVNRFVIDLTTYYGDGEQLGFYLVPRGGDLQDAQYQETTTFRFHDFLLSATPNQEIVLVAYPAVYAPDSPVLAEDEVRGLTAIEDAIEANAAITDDHVGFLSDTSVQGFIFQRSE